MPVSARKQHASPARRRFSSSEQLAARTSPASESVSPSRLAHTILRRQIRATRCRIRMTSRSTQFTLPAAAGVGQGPPPPSIDTSGILPSRFGSKSSHSCFGFLCCRTINNRSGSRRPLGRILFHALFPRMIVFIDRVRADENPPCRHSFKTYATGDKCSLFNSPILS